MAGAVEEGDAGLGAGPVGRDGVEQAQAPAPQSPLPPSTKPGSSALLATGLHATLVVPMENVRQRLVDVKVARQLVCPSNSI